MNSNRKTPAIVGALFLTALVTDLIGGDLIEGIIHAPDYLISTYPNRIRVITGMVLELIAAAAVVGIPIVLFSTLREEIYG
ncbi:MAG: hypothetical protein ABIJ00_00850 [Candidatus Eisenbacteria bacterium]